MKPNTTFLLLFVCCICFVNIANAIPINKTDSLTLVNLYNSADGVNWTHNDNWLTQQPVSTWYGVTVTGNRVTRLNLYNNNLQDTLPDDLGNLTALVLLDLHYNYFMTYHSGIPATIGNLVNLTYLDISGTHLGDTIPASIGNLVKLDTLYLFQSDLVGSIPESIGNLTHLKIFDIHEDQLTGGIPASIGNLGELEYFDAYLVPLGGSLPQTIGGLKKLKHLNLPFTQLTGAIPSSIGNWVDITFLNLGYNQLTGNLPASIGNFHLLQSFNAQRNELSGSIPASIGKDTSLQELNLYNNQLTGIIPASIGKLVKLTILNLSNNQLSGSLPSSIGKLVNMEHCDLNNNQLSGSLPSSISGMGKYNHDPLHYFDLHLDHNQLTGSIPSSIVKIGKGAGSVGITLDYNQLTGSLPDNMNKWGIRLSYLGLSHNQLSQTDNIDLPSTPGHGGVAGNVSYNLFTFNGMELLDKKFHRVTYAPQAPIAIQRSGNVLFVAAGGTLSKNTFQWFELGKEDSTTIKGDSTFTPAKNGRYYAHITNAIATQLTLTTDTIDYTAQLTVNNNAVATKSVLANAPAGHFIIYPSPASDKITIQTNGPATFAIVNAAGKLMLTKTINNNGTVRLSNFANGWYYVRNNLSGEVQKIVVSR